MSEDRFREAFRRITAETPDAPAFSDLETHRAKPAAAPIRFKPWMAAVGAAALVLVVVGAFGLLGGGGPDLAAPDEGTIDYIKLEYSATVNPVCEGGEIIDNGGFDEATIEIWGPNSDDLTLMVATFPDGSTERTVVEGEPTNPDLIWVEGDPEEYPETTKARQVRCEGTANQAALMSALSAGMGPRVPSLLLGPPPGFDTWGEAMTPSQEPTLTEWNGTAALLYQTRDEGDAGSNAIDIYVTEDDTRILRLHAEQNYPGVGSSIIDYTVVASDRVPSDSVSFDKSGLTPIAQVVAELGQEDCPVTIPSQAFTPPEGYPATPSDPDSVWFGKDELWTVLSTDGISEGRKSVWWSANFTDPGIESSPEITVTYTLLNSATALTIVNDQGTNASTPEDGLFIIAGSEPDIEGCWQVTAIYKNASLSYIYYNPEGQDPAVVTSVVPDVVGMTVDLARLTINSRGYKAQFHDSDDSGFEICAQEPGAGLEIELGATIGMRTASPGGCDELMDTTTTGERCLEYQYLPPPEDYVGVVFFNCGDGEGPTLRPVGRTFTDGAADAPIVLIMDAMEYVLAGPTAAERADGFASLFSEESAGALLTGTIKDRHLILDFTEDITVNNASTSTGSTFFLAELYANVFQFEEVESVEFQINGSCEAFWEFLQAGPVCNVIDRPGWEQMQSQWESG